MIKYTAVCAEIATDYITAERFDAHEVALFAFRGGERKTSAYLQPADARTFARGILALADEIDGGEASDEPLKVGDIVRIVQEYGDDQRGRNDGATGCLMSVDMTDRGFPYEVDVPDYGSCGAHSVERVARGVAKEDETTAPVSSADPTRVALLQEAKALQGDSAFIDESTVAVARFLAGA